MSDLAIRMGYDGMEEEKNVQDNLCQNSGSYFSCQVLLVASTAHDKILSHNTYDNK